MDTKESSCQTELDEILRRRMEEFGHELEQVRQTMEKESAEEKEDFEMRVRNEYNEIIKAKDEPVKVFKTLNSWQCNILGKFHILKKFSRSELS